MKLKFSAIIFKSLLASGIFISHISNVLSVENNTLVVGVRADAAPFSYSVQGPEILRPERIIGDIGKKGYAGYVVQICDEVITQIKREPTRNLDIKVVKVSAQDRFKKLRDGTIDILCGPSTIKEERIYDLLVSVPIYLSGISFAKQKEFPNKYCGHLVGFVGTTTAQTDGIREILAEGEWPRYNKTLTDYLSNPDAWENDDPDCVNSELIQGGEKNPEALNKSNDTPIKAFKDHNALADAFCNNDVLYYVGDIEIVSAKLSERKSCEFELANRTFSEERYAIYTRSPSTSTDKALYLFKFMGELARQIYKPDSLLIKSFKNNFIGYQPSPKLELFYWSITGRYP